MSALLDQHRALGLMAPPSTGDGAGITVAVLDGGVASLPVFGDRLDRIHAEGHPDQSPPSDHATCCASLIASDAVGLAPGARILSVNVSRDGRADPERVTAALVLLRQRRIPIASCSFVLEALPEALADAANAYLSDGFLLIGAAANAARRRRFPFVRALPGAIRVFADRVPTDPAPLEPGIAPTGALEVGAPGRALHVIGVGGAHHPNWRGQSSGATALIAGWCARHYSPGKDLRPELAAIAAPNHAKSA